MIASAIKDVEARIGINRAEEGRDFRLYGGSSYNEDSIRERAGNSHFKANTPEGVEDHEIEYLLARASVSPLPTDPNLYLDSSFRVYLDIVSLENGDIVGLVYASQVYGVLISDEDAAFYVNEIDRLARHGRRGKRKRGSVSTVEGFRLPKMIFNSHGINAGDFLINVDKPKGIFGR